MTDDKPHPPGGGEGDEVDIEQIDPPSGMPAEEPEDDPLGVPEDADPDDAALPGFRGGEPPAAS